MSDKKNKKDRQLENILALLRTASEVHIPSRQPRREQVLGLQVPQKSKKKSVKKRKLKTEQNENRMHRQ